MIEDTAFVRIATVAIYSYILARNILIIYLPPSVQSLVQPLCLILLAPFPDDRIMAHHEVWVEAQTLAGEHRPGQFLSPPPFAYPQSSPPECCVGCLNPTREGVSTTAVLQKSLHKLHANRYHGSPLYTRWPDYGLDDATLYKRDSKGFGQGFNVEEADAMAKESVVAYGRRDQVGSQAHSLGMGRGI